MKIPNCIVRSNQTRRSTHPGVRRGCSRPHSRSLRGSSPREALRSQVVPPIARRGPSISPTSSRADRTTRSRRSPVPSAGCAKPAFREGRHLMQGAATESANVSLSRSGQCEGLDLRGDLVTPSPAHTLRRVQGGTASLGSRIRQHFFQQALRIRPTTTARPQLQHL